MDETIRMLLGAILIVPGAVLIGVAKYKVDRALHLANQAMALNRDVARRVLDLAQPEAMFDQLDQRHLNTARLALCSFVEAAQQDGALGYHRDGENWWARTPEGYIEFHRHLMDAVNAVYPSAADFDPQDDLRMLDKLGYKVVETGLNPDTDWRLRRDRHC